MLHGLAVPNLDQVRSQQRVHGERIVSAPIEIIAAVGIIAFVIARQLAGEPLRGKRVVLLPIVLTIIGLTDLGGHGSHVRPIDVALLIAGGGVVAGIGVAQGAVLQVESRNGYLWGRMPIAGLWMWLLLVASRVVLTVIAHGTGAEVAGSGSTILLMLGINRLGQAAVVLPRAMSARIPFAPESDGASFLAGLTDAPQSPLSSPETARVSAPGSPTGTDWPALGRQVLANLQTRHRAG